MKKYFTLTVMLISGITLLVSLIFGLKITQSNNYSSSEEAVKNYCQIYCDTYLAAIANKDNQNNQDKNIYFKDLMRNSQVINENVRITIIDKNGNILLENKPLDLQTMENHLNRDEVKNAINGTPKVSIRYSNSTGVKQMYYAKKLDIGNDDLIIIRTSVPVKKIDSYLYNTIPLMLFVIFLLLGLAGFIGDKLSRRLLAPLELVKNTLSSINNGKYINTFPVSEYNEINQLLAEIDDISKKLKENFTITSEEKNKLNFIINNISDGIFALDDDNNIILINNSAKKMFNITSDITNKNLLYLTYDKILQDMIKSTKKDHGTVDFEYKNKENNKIYSVLINRIGKSWDGNVNDNSEDITVVMLSDITTEKNNEILRSQFFSNAGHELKTPLTSIIGFNQLCKLKNKDADMDKYIDQVEKESKRMLMLISDMMKLSSLENSNINMEIKKQKIDLSKVVEEAFITLSPLALEKNIKLILNNKNIKDRLTTDNKTTINIDPNHAFEIVKNLIENSIKYNVKDGKVNVEVNYEKSTNKVILKVKDTGIGLNDEDKERMFERFYRADKGRSRVNGGTGLGLSIVKHICQLYNCKILVDSKVDMGTTISIYFDAY